MNHLLAYLESGSKGTIVRPWVWIVALFLGPMSESITWEVYIFFTTRLLVRTEGILTHLVFERALKMRFTDDSAERTTQKPAESTASTLVHTPDSEGGAEQAVEQAPGGSDREERLERSEGGETVREASDDSGSADRKGKGKETSSPKAKKDKSAPTPVTTEKKPDKQGSNLVGRLNNMVSTDLKNIVECEDPWYAERSHHALTAFCYSRYLARDFLMPVLAAFQVGLCLWFLYTILGWSALVGLATMILTFPVPGM